MTAAPVQDSQPGLITVQRDIEAIQVPYGTPVTLRKDTKVSVVHVLGGMFTVRTEHGFLVRVDGKDADALGQAVPKDAEAPAASSEFREEAVWEVLRTCYDPEIPVNIVELGLVYGCRALPLAPSRYRIEIDLTLTAPGCGMGQVLKDDVERKLLAVPCVAEAAVNIVFNPPWDPTRMSEAARLELGMM